MLILGIETSCDDTSCALVQDGRLVISNLTQSSVREFQDLGGIIPEQAARRQLLCILPVVEGCLRQARSSWDAIDAIAVTKGPGLIGSLLVGTATARVLARIFDKPLIPVHHTLGHVHSTWLMPKDSDVTKGTEVTEVENTSVPPLGPELVAEGSVPSETSVPSFPILTLSVSGGHTELWYRTDFLKGKILGQTLDDAAGEAFDKGAVLLGLPFPGGPALGKLAEGGNPNAHEFPLPLAKEPGLDFSFSGLKTALKYLLQDLRKCEERNAKFEKTEEAPSLRSSTFAIRSCDVAASYQEALCSHLIDRVKKALKQCSDVKEVHLVGGVSANLRLRSLLTDLCQKRGVTLRLPLDFAYCTDNAAMIAGAAYVLWREFGEEAAADFETSPSVELTEIR